MNFFDLAVFEWLNHFAGRNTLFDFSVIFFGSWLVWLFPFFVLWVLLRDPDARNTFSQFFIVLLAPLLSGAILGIIRLMYNRPRPFEMIQMANQLLQHAPGGSFPSGHATFSFTIAAAMYWWRPRGGMGFVIAATLISISRVIGGIHWPMDIIAGALIGIFAARATKNFSRKKPPLGCSLFLN